MARMNVYLLSTSNCVVPAVKTERSAEKLNVSMREILKVTEKDTAVATKRATVA
jgi:hypothetical protein